ncbi:MAG: hypothetical protein JWR44_1497 [Hymenobacter sp.]|nr:hypothetical protein [Hymenobacter sp.]
MSTPMHPRAPRLSETELRQALDELDAKIQTLRNRAHATAAGSPNTYQQHADALETKRAQLAEQLGRASTSGDGAEPSVWAQIKSGIEKLGDDVRAVL